MNLFILRHGIAESGQGKDDSKRRLTSLGRKESTLLGGYLKDKGISFEMILSSPYSRAWQTAELVAKELKAESRLAQCDDLVPGFDRSKLLQQLRKLAKKHKSILLVGHEPDLGKLLGWLVVGHGKSPIKMKKGALAKLMIDKLSGKGCAELEWIVTAEIFA